MLHANLFHYTDTTIWTELWMWQILTVFIICTAHYIHILKFKNLHSDSLVAPFSVFCCCMCVYSLILYWSKIHMHKSDHVISRQLDAFYKLITHVTNIQINKTALSYLPITLPPFSATVASLFTPNSRILFYLFLSLYEIDYTFITL